MVYVNGKVEEERADPPPEPVLQVRLVRPRLSLLTIFLILFVLWYGPAELLKGFRGFIEDVGWFISSLVQAMEEGGRREELMEKAKGTAVADGRAETELGVL